MDDSRPLVCGAAVTRFGRHLDRGLASLAGEAAAGALADAGASARNVEVVYFANAAAGVVCGQEMIRGQVALSGTPLEGVPVINVENACASGSTAFHLACLAVGSGQADVALAIGCEKLASPLRERSFRALAAGVDVERAGTAAFVLGDEEEVAGAGGGGSLFMDIYADEARDFMERTDATARDLAEAASKTRRHGSLNERAQYRDAPDAEAVLASRHVAGPLTLLMCSPIGDGAAALVVASPDWARHRGHAPVQVRASQLRAGRAERDCELVRTTARAAYHQAGVGPADLDVIELHDATSSAELLLYAELGLCDEGRETELLRSGATRLGGRVPVNPSGGLLSRGHPLGATGCAQLVELADQLRGRCGPRQAGEPRLALAENAGGNLGGRDPAACCVTILGRR